MSNPKTDLKGGYLGWICKLFGKALASLIFAPFGKAQKNLALLSLIAKIGYSVGLWGFGPDISSGCLQNALAF
ncbi:MAG: hypothetical protein JXR50_00470 [Prolixibacteraceae bacterium]|nr:hypothetical protein [Prolixibacteraceae bacterium]MBN2648195.1 hypothetical protein [Prolixibacteraceae bacterium]